MCVKREREKQRVTVLSVLYWRTVGTVVPYSLVVSARKQKRVEKKQVLLQYGMV